MTDTFAAIASQRRALADILESFDETQWATPSLCSGWTVHEVVAHLTMPFLVGSASAALRLVKARGNFDRMTDEYARSKASVPGPELVSVLRANAEHRFTPPGHGPLAPLTDIVVHGMDIGVPAGREPVVPVDVVNAVLGFLTSRRAALGFVPRGRLSGLRLVASDTGWSAGSGEEVNGPAESLILAIAGRVVGLQSCQGPGAATLLARSTRT